jgi:hypothetical protein
VLRRNLPPSSEGRDKSTFNPEDIGRTCQQCTHKNSGKVVIMIPRSLVDDNHQFRGIYYLVFRGKHQISTLGTLGASNNNGNKFNNFKIQNIPTNTASHPE